MMVYREPEQTRKDADDIAMSDEHWNRRNAFFDDEKTGDTAQYYSTIEETSGSPDADAQSGDYEHVYEEPPSVYDHVIHDYLVLLDDDTVIEEPSASPSVIHDYLELLDDDAVIQQPSASPAAEAVSGGIYQQPSAIPDYLELLEDDLATPSAEN